MEGYGRDGIPWNEGARKCKNKKKISVILAT